MKRQLYTFAAGKTRIVRMKRVLAGMFSLLAFTGAGAEGFVPDVNPSAIDTAKVVDVEEVVVVASPKENIKLRKQPVSVTLFSGEGLDNLGVTSVKDLTGFVHNLYIPDYGSRLTSSVYIRGIGSRMNTPAVGMYVDNMPYIDKSAYDFTFLDIDRIDVLNGPQGTLYGRNSMGGLFRVFTSDPLRKQGTKVSLGATGRTTGRRISATTNQKIGNKFAYSVGGYYNAENGFFRNDSTGRKADGSQEAGARLRAVYKANNKLKFDFQTTYSYSDEDAYPYYYRGKAPSATGGEEYPEYIGRITANRQGKYRRNILNSGLNITYKKPTYTLSSVTSYQFLQDRMYMDQDFLAADIYSLEQRQRAQTFSEELSLKTTGKRWNSTTGLFAMYQHMHTTTPVTFYEDGMAMLNTTIASHLPEPTFTNPFTQQPMTIRMNMKLTDPSMVFAGNYRTPVTNFAVFHQSVFNDFLVRNVDLTVGLRVDVEHQELDYHMTGNDINYNFGMTMAPAANLVARADSKGSHKDDYVQLLPKVALQYNFERAGNVYVTFSKGYRSGGYNIQMASELAQTKLQSNLMQGAKDYVGGLLQQQIDNAQSEAMKQMFTGIKNTVDKNFPEFTVPGAKSLRYKPEYSYNYEAGAHLNLLGRSLQVNAALFFMDTYDQQIARYSVSGLGRQMVNAGRSHSCGAELEIRSALFDNRLNLSASYGFTHAEFVKYHDGKNNYKGKYVPMVPMHNMGIAANYNVPLNAGVLHGLTFGADVVGLGRIYWTERNDVYQNFYANLGAHVTADLGIASLKLWGKNLTCAKYDTFYFESMSRGFSQQGIPCHFGADVVFSF